ncbi:MAG: hypothetical protein EHM42_01700, partial [Planctomycetaceae bacterium]
MRGLKSPANSRASSHDPRLNARRVPLAAWPPVVYPARPQVRQSGHSRVRQNADFAGGHPHSCEFGDISFMAARGVRSIADIDGSGTSWFLPHSRPHGVWGVARVNSRTERAAPATLAFASAREPKVVDRSAIQRSIALRSTAIPVAHTARCNDRIKHSSWCDMTTRWLVCLVVVLGSLPTLTEVGHTTEISWKGSGQGGAVAAGHQDAVAAGIQVLREGGNAADAAAATLLALAVTDYGSFAIGGEVPLLIFDAKKSEVKVLCGQGAAPLDPQAIDRF